MSTPQVDSAGPWVSHEDEFIFPDDDGLTDQILADLNVEFPKCSISQSVAARSDILADVMAQIFPGREKNESAFREGDDQNTTIPSVPNEESDGETVLISSNEVGSTRPIPAEVSSQSNQSGIEVVARKSAPPVEGACDTTNPAIKQEMVEPMEVSNDCQIIATFPPRRQQPPAIVVENEDGFPLILGSLAGRRGKDKKKLEALSIAAQITQSVAQATGLREEIASGTFVKNGESGFVKHNYPEAWAEELKGPDPVPADVPGQEDFSSVRELALPGQTTMRTVPAGSIAFVLVEFDAGRWNIVSIEKWEEIINEIEMRVLQFHKELKFVVRGTSRWRGCGSITLDGNDLSLLEKWRDIVPNVGEKLNTFPKDALLLSDELTIMLRSDLRTFKTRFLMYSLFSRNTSLKGHARVTCSKEYGKDDLTSLGISMEGWRLCYVEGDILFLQSLMQHTVLDQFKVGCGLVTIRGGVRKPTFLKKNFARIPLDVRRWIRPGFAPYLRSLTPVPLVRNNGPSVDSIPKSADMSGIVRSLSVPATTSEDKDKEEIRPRTRSQRLKMQKEKKLAFRRKSNLKSIDK